MSEEILVVDDEEAGLYTETQMLKRAGFEVLQARTGGEGLDMLNQHQPRLVVLDVRLPDISGLEVCRRIKANPETAAILVLQTSATFTTEHDVAKSLESGADASLTEPVDPGVLIATVHALLRARRAEDALRSALAREQEARAAAESVNRIKDDFLATLSHELRSPLGSILTWITLLRSGKMDAAQTAVGLETIERNTRLQTKLIEDLLDVSRIVSGKLSLEPVELALAPVVESAVDAVRAHVMEKGIHLEIHLDPDIGVYGDAARLQQVVWNLLSNAVKFTSASGTVEVALRRDGSDAVIEVRDTGAGIEPDFLPHIFDRFRQEDSSTTRRSGGLGLGLAIVSHIVALHHGQVEAKSAGRGQGATFDVRLPLRSGSTSRWAADLLRHRASSPIRTMPVILAGKEILVVDDDADARAAVAAVLQQAGAAVTTAASVVEAVALLRNWTPHLIISDIGMPREDGFVLVERIHAASEALKAVPVLGLTAYAAAEDRQRVLRGGFTAWLSKPVEALDLVRTAADLVNK